MFKRIVPALILMAASTAMFAAPVKAKVTSIKDKSVVVKVDGEAASWMKKGQAIRINGKLNGKIEAVEGATVTLKSPKAAELKEGDAITFDKSLAAAGC